LCQAAVIADVELAAASDLRVIERQVARIDRRVGL
jgi:hypothetical protein